MDISQIKDKKELKSLGYDQMAIIEQAQANLRAINQQLAVVEQEEAEKNKTQPDEKKV